MLPRSSDTTGSLFKQGLQPGVMNMCKDFEWPLSSVTTEVWTYSSDCQGELKYKNPILLISSRPGVAPGRQQALKGWEWVTTGVLRLSLHQERGAGSPPTPSRHSQTGAQWRAWQTRRDKSSHQDLCSRNDRVLYTLRQLQTKPTSAHVGGKRRKKNFFF